MATHRESDQSAVHSRRWLNWFLAAALVCVLALIAVESQTIWSHSPQKAQPTDRDAPRLNTAAPPGPAPEGMVWVPGGEFWMGSEKGYGDERPRHKVYVDGFWMDRTEVTNAQFAKFVEATKYLTVAERPPRPEDFPEAARENLAPGSAVFTPPDQPVDLNGPPVWWKYVVGASWRHPEGPGSNIAGRENHPAVHLSWDDAVVYAKWAGKRLPTEAEWEFAARGGLDRARFVWGDELKPGGKWMANTWQGEFPNRDTGEDGFKGVAPVAKFPPNGYGLFDMSGNVWEWCSDWYQPDYYRHSPFRNPQGPESGAADEFDVVTGVKPQPCRVRRGGSFYCTDQYCRRYLPSARDKNPPDSSASHTGVRCVLSPAPPK
jgi:sulfatase modifying factor 1